jgi:hypothetical protein
MSDLENFFGEEELLPELQPYLTENSVLGTPSIHHPLIISILHVPQLNKMINKSFLHKQEAIAKAIKKQNWISYVFLHERPYRLQALLDVTHMIEDDSPSENHPSWQAYAELVASIWTDSENIWQNFEEWFEIWEDLKNRDLLKFTMEDHENEFLASSDLLTLYRGTSEDLDAGMSWTLDKNKAEWFAKRFNKDTPVVLETVVKASEVYAYYTGRNEQEIVINPFILGDVNVV